MPANKDGLTPREIYGFGPAGQPNFFCDACDCHPCQCHKPVYTSAAEPVRLVVDEPQDDGRHIPLADAMAQAMSVYAGAQSAGAVRAAGPRGGAQVGARPRGGARE